MRVALFVGYGGLYHRIIDLHVDTHGLFGILDSSVSKKGRGKCQGDSDKLRVYCLFIHLPVFRRESFRSFYTRPSTRECPSKKALSERRNKRAQRCEGWVNSFHRESQRKLRHTAWTRASTKCWKRVDRLVCACRSRWQAGQSRVRT